MINFSYGALKLERSIHYSCLRSDYIFRKSIFSHAPTDTHKNTAGILALCTSRDERVSAQGALGPGGTMRLNYLRGSLSAVKHGYHVWSITSANTCLSLSLSQCRANLFGGSVRRGESEPNLFMIDLGRFLFLRKERGRKKKPYSIGRALCYFLV